MEISAHQGRWAQRALKGFDKWLAEREVIDDDPAARMKTIREPQNPNPPTVAEDVIDRLLAVIGDDDPMGVRDRAILHTLWSTGMRRGELVRLRLPDVDVEAGTLSIWVTKTKQPRTAPLTTRALDALAVWLEARWSWKPPADVDHLWLGRYQATPYR